MLSKLLLKKCEERLKLQQTKVPFVTERINLIHFITASEIVTSKDLFIVDTYIALMKEKLKILVLSKLRKHIHESMIFVVNSGDEFGVTLEVYFEYQFFTRTESWL